MKIDQRKNGRFVIVDDNGQVADDAQGYGYKSKQSAHKAMWYKFQGGKEKIESRKRQRNDVFKQHKGLERFIDRWYETWFKELVRGEMTEDDLLQAIKDEFGMNFPKELLCE